MFDLIRIPIVIPDKHKYGYNDWQTAITTQAPPTARWRTNEHDVTSLAGYALFRNYRYLPNRQETSKTVFYSLILCRLNIILCILNILTQAVILWLKQTQCSFWLNFKKREQNSFETHAVKSTCHEYSEAKIKL